VQRTGFPQAAPDYAAFQPKRAYRSTCNPLILLKSLTNETQARIGTKLEIEESDTASRADRDVAA